MKHVNVYTDGASRGNPGPAGLGVVLKDDSGKKIKEFHKALGVTTNNAAEYYAVIYGLQEALFQRADDVDLYVDSELVAEQLNGQYKVKNENLKTLFEQAAHLISGFKKFRVNNIPRELNKDADKLANKAINLSGLL